MNSAPILPLDRVVETKSGEKVRIVAGKPLKCGGAKVLVRIQDPKGILVLKTLELSRDDLAEIAERGRAAAGGE